MLKKHHVDEIDAVNIEGALLYAFKVIPQESEFYIASASSKGDDILSLIEGNRIYFGYNKEEKIIFEMERVCGDTLEIFCGEYFINGDTLCICTDEVFKLSLGKVS